MNHHYVVVIGPSLALANELRLLKEEGSVPGCRLVAVPSRKPSGVSMPAIEQAVDGLVELLKDDGCGTMPARLSVWAYESDVQSFVELWKAFGRSGWVELIPRNLQTRIRPTREFIEQRSRSIAPLLHEISFNVFNKRKTSPLSIPFINFKSQYLSLLRTHWYIRYNVEGIKTKIRSSSDQFREYHTRDRAHIDDRALIFSPAPNEACHGVSHPTGSESLCFIDGRFRFGVALYPGHHYDVRERRGTLKCILYDCSGRQRNMSGENREYINIFPNDHLLPVAP
jgi:hypothetical protein